MFEPFHIPPTPHDPERHRSKEQVTEIAELRADVERLYFITEALWRILREKQGLDENDIVRQITEIDMEDGKLDGRKPKTPPQPCPKCRRTLGKQRMKCIFCGEFVIADPFER